MSNIASSHSAEVAMWLDCGPHGRVDLRRTGPLMVEIWPLGRDIPPCTAVLVIEIDGVPHTQTVNLADGIKLGEIDIAAYPIDDIAPF